jgi:alkylated DNA nucleotide flippase Atl1
MPKSEAVEGIKRDVLLNVASIPAGRITTFGSIGDRLEVMARHVAFLLANLDEGETAGILWYPVVGIKGALGQANHARFARQREFLSIKGLEVDADGLLRGFQDVFVEPGGPRGTRPVNAAGPGGEKIRVGFIDQRAARFGTCLCALDPLRQRDVKSSPRSSPTNRGFCNHGFC